jgi:hypothetical protein
MGISDDDDSVGDLSAVSICKVVAGQPEGLLLML